MIAITGATGQLGRLVIAALQRLQPGIPIVAAVRDSGKATDIAGVDVRHADYDRPETLASAFQDVEKLLLISSNDLGGRQRQHAAVIDAAKAAGVKMIAYTSILHTDTSPLDLTIEHRATEAYLQASGVPYVLLRNGWYTENDTAALQSVLQHGAFIGSSGAGKLSWAARADYAEAAAVVLLSNEHVGRTYELAGDNALNMTELAALTAQIAGKPIVYADLQQQDYRTALIGAGLPDVLATMLADSSAKAGAGALFDDSRTLSWLIGRPTTPVQDTIKAALKA